MALFLLFTIKWPINFFDRFLENSKCPLFYKNSIDFQRSILEMVFKEFKILFRKYLKPQDIFGNLPI